MNTEAESLLLIPTKCHCGSRVSEVRIAQKATKLPPAALPEPVLSPPPSPGPQKWHVAEQLNTGSQDELQRLFNSFSSGKNKNKKKCLNKCVHHAGES